MPHSFPKYYTYHQRQHPQVNPQMAPAQDFNKPRKLRGKLQQQRRQAPPGETSTYKGRASSLPQNAPPRGTSTSAQTPITSTSNTNLSTIDLTASDTSVKSIDTRKSSSTVSTTSTTSTTFRSYCKVPRPVIETAIATATLVDTSQSPFTQREAEEMIRIRHLHRWNPDLYFDAIGGSVGKVAECVARNSTISHPRACVIAFLRVVDELW